MSRSETRLVLTAGPLRSEWLYGETDDQCVEVVDALLGEPGPQVFQLYLAEKIATDDGFPLVYLTVAVDGPVGAAHFYDHYADRDSDVAAVTIGTVATKTIMFRPEVGIAFPPDATVSRDVLRELMLEFIATGARPATVRWQPVDFV